MVKRSMFRREEPLCGWCGAYHREHYLYEPFIAYRPHSPELAGMHDEAAELRPHPSTARWVPEDREFILYYLAWRDHERCGLCAMPLPAGVGHIEHIVPKRFGRFDHRRGLVTSGSDYESRLHHVDNLQAAHDYCNRAKGNSPKVADWRHPDMWSLPVAIKRATPHTYLWVPGDRKTAARPTHARSAHAPSQAHAPPPPRSAPMPTAPKTSRPYPSARRPSRKSVVLYTIAALIAFSGLTAGWQSGSAGVIWMLFSAALFFIWARRSRN